MMDKQSRKPSRRRRERREEKRNSSVPLTVESVRLISTHIVSKRIKNTLERIPSRVGRQDYSIYELRGRVASIK